ncbi:hypothetical protein GCM10018785_11660 [Streptomyces longispororuber]|uniref:Uncharacterized protein n=1 Tax=Streptomyces longispororuber TaxID=68230 RepID=A0A919DHV2_9ACTN|nr:hypothetical protein GCM10018785_11660 [Streptomyces longispororuber]
MPSSRSRWVSRVAPSSPEEARRDGRARWAGHGRLGSDRSWAPAGGPHVRGVDHRPLPVQMVLRPQGQVFPLDASVQDEENAAQGLPVRHPSLPWTDFGPGFDSNASTNDHSSCQMDG